MTVQIFPKPRHLEPCEDLSCTVPACGGGGSVGGWGGQGLSRRLRDAQGVGGRKDAHRAVPVQIRETISWSRFKSRPGRLLQLISYRNGALLSFGRVLGFALGLAPLTQFFSGMGFRWGFCMHSLSLLCGVGMVCACRHVASPVSLQEMWESLKLHL